jgi:hypothetical protein
MNSFQLKTIICLITYFCFLGSLFLVFYIYNWYHKRKNHIAPFTEKFYRAPGQSINEKIQVLNDDINTDLFPLIFIPTCVMFFFLYMNLYEKNMINIVNIIVFIIFLGTEIFYLKRLINRLNKRRPLRLGYEGEIAVGQELNLLMLDGYHVFHDLVPDTIKKFNIDHIIVGSSGVYSVETKTRSKSSDKKGSKNSTVIYDGASLIFPRYTDTASLKQARINAIWLQKWLTSAVGEPVNVDAILTIPGWYVERRSAPRGVNVLSPKEIKSFLKNKKETPLSDSMIKRIVHQLDRVCRDVEPFTVQIEKEDRKQAATSA